MKIQQGQLAHVLSKKNCENAEKYVVACTTQQLKWCTMGNRDHGDITSVILNIFWVQKIMMTSLARLWQGKSMPYHVPVIHSEWVNAGTIGPTGIPNKDKINHPLVQLLCGVPLTFLSFHMFDIIYFCN